MSAHVPAWKRLGLKLKDASLDTPGLDNVTNGSRHGNPSSDDARDERPAKRLRVANGLDSRSDRSKVLPKNQRNEARGKLGLTSAHNIAHVKGKKSVKFSTETKHGDGDTRTTIDFPVTASNFKGKSHKEPEEVAKTASLSTPNGQESDLVKRTKKKSTKKQKPATHTRDKTGPALDYLLQHRSNKAAWKFNKNRDAWILSHALDPLAIPSTHLLALAGYLQGLPDNAASRQRLVEQCQNALNDSTDLSHHESRNEFLAIVEDQSRTVFDGNTVIEQCPRALLVLWSLGEDKVALAPRTTQPGKIAKSRKSRTSAPIDLSSSESESETEDDSDESSSSGSDDTDSDSDSSASTKVKPSTSTTNAIRLKAKHSGTLANSSSPADTTSSDDSSSSDRE